MGWIGPSLTLSASPNNENPAWSYYEVDKNTYSIMNARTYFCDISKVNSQWTVAPFQLEYDVRQEYDPTKSWPANQPLDGHFWDHYLAQVIDTNHTIATIYNKYAVRDSPGVKSCSTSSCLKYEKCRIQAGTKETASKCIDLDDRKTNASCLLSHACKHSMQNPSLYFWVPIVTGA